MYKFNLQSVLDHRQLTEDSLKRELAEIQRHRQAARQQLESLEEREKHTMALLKQEQADGISSDGVVGFHAYLARLSQQIIKQKMALCDLQQKESAKLNELGEALKKRKILEKLKDQGLRRYQRMIVKEEMQYIDEVAVNQYVRRRMAKNGNGK